jgi:hypothetical protein
LSETIGDDFWFGGAEVFVGEDTVLAVVNAVVFVQPVPRTKRRRKALSR